MADHDALALDRIGGTPMHPVASLPALDRAGSSAVAAPLAIGSEAGAAALRRRRPLRLDPATRFPDIELPDHAGNPRSLRELVGGDPTVLHFYRGFWCPKEQAFFRRLVALQEEAEVAYSRVVSVSVDSVDACAALRAGIGARWTFLSDAERTAQPLLGLRETTDTVHHPYVPRVFTLAPDLTIHRVYDGYWFWGRPTLEELRRDLRELSAAVRPDWRAPVA